ncbi:pyridoxal kinase [Hyalella azteca]|uniref:Pyridoxal kinase n=1 Tax=Hyalella azteca TaxID=294128 RepID=A0A8B7NFR0_HYAAZ|nr:pyridoxal kinase [Hyalella azteca]
MLVMDVMKSDGRVLSLQSHVVSGYVGNKSATFPLQVLGLEVDAINSVQFSNHTGYAHFKGQVMNAQELDELLEGLHLNGLSVGKYSHLLTGYIGSESFLKAVGKSVQVLKQDNPGMTYVCDPVMGDNGAMYVPAELLPIYRETIVPLADIITPNQYEAELLSEKKIETEADVAAVLDWFHDKGVKTVVLSSTDLGNAEQLIGIASTKEDEGSCTRLRIAMPRLPVNFTGTGDLFAALLLGWLFRSGHDLKMSVENTVATMQSILTATYAHAVATSSDAAGDKKLTPASLELRLVQSLDCIREPRVVIKATRI